MNVLITGGAGYIGSHTAKELWKHGHVPVTVDNLSRGHEWAVKWGPLEHVDLIDRVRLRRVFDTYSIGAVIHFAAFAYVGESMGTPSEYFRNNVVNTLNVLDAMREFGVSNIVFSSTCATYGDPQYLPLTELHPQSPVNPYGESKLMVERMLKWYERAYRIKYTALRYFNAAGADPDGEIGELHDPEPHLIPRAIAAALGRAPKVDVYGSDYDTCDGTAVRDYIHVADLASAHRLALKRMCEGAPGDTFNLGTGQGHSVMQVIRAVEQVGNRRVPYRLSPRRSGDPATLVADPRKAQALLGWNASLSSLETIVETAWNWQTSGRGSGIEVMHAVTR